MSLEKKNRSLELVTASYSSMVAHRECKVGLWCAGLDLVKIPQYLHIFTVSVSTEFRSTEITKPSGNLLKFTLDIYFPVVTCFLRD